CGGGVQEGNIGVMVFRREWELEGNDLLKGFCSLCNSRNPCDYDLNPNSFDCPPDSYHPPHPTYETYSGDSCGNDSHFGYDCQPQFLLNYMSKPGHIKNRNSYPYDSSSFPQQEPCCEDCGGLSEADHCQPPQYTVNHPIFNAHNDLLNANNDLLNSQNKITIAQNKLMEQLTSMCAMIFACCNDDDDSAITTNEPVDSLSMGDEHLNTISATKSDEFIKSCVENLVPNPSDDDQSCSDEDVPEKIFSNPLFEEEIIAIKIDQHHNNAESTHDSSLIISSKIDSLLDEFAGELTLLKSIPPGIDETNCYHENDIRLIERLLYDNSSPRPLEEFVSENSDAEIESFSPSPIPIEDSDSFTEEIDLTFTLDDPMSSCIKDDDYDSEKDILIHEELLDNYSLSLPVIESFHFDISSFSRPPAKPPDGNTGILNIKMMGDISKQKKCEDSCQRILSFKSSFPQLQLGIHLLHLAGSQPMLKSSYKAEGGVIISIPPLVGGMADVVVKINGTETHLLARQPHLDCSYSHIGVSEEELKGMMQLVPLEEVYIEALQTTKDKEKELWVELKRLFEPDSEDQLWTYHQALMHDPLDWKLYDTCGVHHVSTKNQEIFMLVEKDYPLRKGLATVMIIQDEELFEASSPGEHLIQET
nr:hypothetical protein [Tanacetum cinerariifolium]